MKANRSRQRAVGGYPRGFRMNHQSTVENASQYLPDAPCATVVQKHASAARWSSKFSRARATRVCSWSGYRGDNRPSVNQSRSLECQSNPVTMGQKHSAIEGQIMDQKPSFGTATADGCHRPSWGCNASCCTEVSCALVDCSVLGPTRGRSGTT